MVNERSNYNGDIKIGENKHPDLYYFKGEGVVQVVSAKTNDAYPGSDLHRTLVLFKTKDFSEPLLIDVFKVNSDNENQYDLPLWYQGHLMQTNFEYKKETTTLKQLGDSAGYQFLWKEAVGRNAGRQCKINLVWQR